MFRQYLLPYLVLWLYRFFALTWKKKVIEPEQMKKDLRENKPLILAHWHGDEIAVLHVVKRYRLATMTSTSKDGSLIDFVIRKMGGATSRGSSTRNAVSALKGLIRLMKAGHTASMAVDGPKGPIYKVKPGVFELARVTKARIVPVGVYAGPKYVFEKAWNKTFLPYPFATNVMVFGEPWEPLGREVDCKDPALAEKLSQDIELAHQQASKLVENSNSD